jgi:hypothetical protein
LIHRHRRVAGRALGFTPTHLQWDGIIGVIQPYTWMSAGLLAARIRRLSGCVVRERPFAVRSCGAIRGQIPSLIARTRSCVLLVEDDMTNVLVKPFRFVEVSRLLERWVPRPA